MDAHERKESQSHRPSKRPWDEDTTSSEKPNPWYGAGLPPIETAPDRRHSGPPRAEKEEGGSFSLYQPLSRDTSKRMKHEGRNYDPISGGTRETRETTILASGYHTPQTPYPAYGLNIGSSEPPSSQAPPQKLELGGKQLAAYHEAASSASPSNLCSRCRRLTTHPQDPMAYEFCEDCRQSPELARVTQNAAAALTQLVQTLSGTLPERGGPIRHFEPRENLLTDCPPVARSGLKPTLDWILDKIYEANELANNLVQHVPPSAFQKFTTPAIPNRPSSRSSSFARDDLISTMKRRMEHEMDDPRRASADDFDPTSDPRFPMKRRSLTTAVESSGENVSSMRAGNDYPYAVDRGGQIASIMNPPPAPSRPLPTSPSRSLPSPTLATFPSPSASYIGGSHQSMSLPPLPNVHPPTNYLPRIGTTGSPDAIHDHTAALQHEVSVQKIALSSLQSEHDKLLSAFSRSQTRAIALEKKHSVSDTEIITLSEEKLRLQSQVVELEREIEELSRSRDQYRQAAVKEGAQYVEIVKKAGQLEEIAAQERKAWAKLKSDMEARIEALMADKPPPSSLKLLDTPGHSEEAIQPKTPPISDEARRKNPSVDSEISTRPGNPDSDHDRALMEEVNFLRRRCKEVENTLSVIRKEGQKMDQMIQRLGLTGKSILDEVNRVLVSDE